MNGGAVQIDIIAAAQENVSAVLKQANAELRQTKKSMKGVEGAAEGAKDGTKGLTAGIKDFVAQGEKVDKVKGRVDMLRGVVEFAIPIVGGLVAVIASIWDDTKDPLEDTRAKVEEINKEFKDGIADLAKWRKELGLASSVELQAGFEKAAAARRAKIEVAASKRVDEAKGLLDAAVGDAFDVSGAMTKRGFAAIQVAKAEIAKAKTEYAQVVADAHGAAAEALRATMASGSFDGGVAGGLVDDSKGFGNLAGKAATAAGKGGKTPKGTDPAKARKAAVAALRDQFAAANDLQSATLGAVDAARAKLETDTELARLQKEMAADAATMGARLAGADPAEEAAKALAKYRKEVERTHAAIHSFGDTLSGALAPALGEMSGLVSSITSIWEGYADAQFSVAGAALSTADAVATSAISQVEDETTLIALLALKEAGLAAATAFVPGMQLESAGHLAGSVILGVAAGVSAAGGGSSGSEGPSRSADDYGVPGDSYGGGSSQSGGGGQTINNVTYVSADVMDGQSVNRAVRRNQQAANGTGWDYRGGW